MKKILSIIIVIFAIFTFVGCGNVSSNSSSGNGGSNNQSENNGNQSQEQGNKVFEGEMLLNGFDSIDDLYKIKTGQTYTNYNIEETVKYDIVGSDDFLLTDSQAKIDKANAALAALPKASSVGAVTNSLRALASKARSLYSALTSSGKQQVNGADNLFAILEKADMNGVYTLGELRQNSCYCGHDLRKGFSSANQWYSACADLINLDEGTIAFTATGIYNNWEKSGDMPNHALQVSLFHDNSEKDSTAILDGIYMRFSSQDSLIYVGSAMGPATIPLQAKLYADAVYTVKIGYKVSSDYKKVLISVYMVDEMEQIVCNDSVEIDTLTNTQHFGSQSVENWLTGVDCYKHTGFLIDTGTSAGATVRGLWEGYGFIEEETTTERNSADLSPRQGRKALRVKYDQTTLFTYIFARFSSSELAGLPVESLGGTSIKVYNDNAETKTVRFLIMRDHGVLVELDDATFDLAPHEWTNCELKFDPYVIEEYYDDIVGVAVEFNDRTSTTYYLDDWRISFEQVRTSEQTAKYNTVISLRSDIDRLYSKQIQPSDAAEVKSVYDRYMSLTQLYKGMLTLEEEKMTNIYTKYIQSLAEKGIADGESRFVLLPTDSEYGLLGIEKGITLPDYATYTTSVKSPTGNGSLRINLASPNVAQGLNVKLADTIYDELHIWVKNDSNSVRAFTFNGLTLYGYRGTAYDEAGNEVIGNYVSMENEIASRNVYGGWIEIVFHDYAMIKKLTFNSGDGFLYIGGIYGVINYDKVNAMIAALPDYYSGYTAAQKAKVEEVRAAYDGLAFITKDRVTNRAKLFEIQARIWRVDYNNISLPSNVSTAQYNEELDIRIDDLIERYNGFEDSGKRIISSEYAKLLQLKARYNSLADEHRNGIVTLNDLNVVETFMSPWEYNDFKMPDGNSNDVFMTVFKRYSLGWGVFYITLFYEARYGEGGGDGIGIIFNDSTLILSDSYIESTKTYYPIESGMKVYTSYVIKVGYIISNDKSSVELVVQLADEDSGSVIMNVSRTYTSINGYSVKDWIANHDLMSFQSAQCQISIKNSWNSLRVTKLEAVESLNNRIKSIDSYSLEQINELKDDYEVLPLIYRMMVKNADKIYQKIDEIIDAYHGNAYTLSELGVNDGFVGTWETKTLTLRNEKEGSAIFKMTKIDALNSQISSFTLFYDGVDASKGVRITFEINKNLTINGTTVEFGNVQPNVEYYYLISYKVSDDYSKVILRIRVETENATEVAAGRGVLGDATLEFTSLIGAASIENWVKANKRLLIDTQQCGFIIASAWKSSEVGIFIDLENFRQAIDDFTGEEDLSYLNGLKEYYDVLPTAIKLAVSNEYVDRLNDAIDNGYKSLKGENYTLNELGVNDGYVGMWENRVLALKDETEGTVIFKMNKVDMSGNHISSFTLFYDGVDASRGVRMTFQINNNLTINGTTVEFGNVQPNVEYYYLISYKVSDDYSKVILRIRVETENATEVAAGRGVLGDATLELTSLIGGSIETWVKANKRLLIDTQQCGFTIASVWSAADIETFKVVNNINLEITDLNGKSQEELNAIKGRYDALPFVFKYLINDIEKLNSAIH